MERVVLGEMEADELQKFLTNVGCHTLVIGRVKPDDSPLFLLGFVFCYYRFFELYDLRVSTVDECLLVVIGGVVEMFHVG